MAEMQRRFMLLQNLHSSHPWLLFCRAKIFQPLSSVTPPAFRTPLLRLLAPDYPEMKGRMIPEIMEYQNLGHIVTSRTHELCYTCVSLKYR
jgi:hypothetical protein